MPAAPIIMSTILSISIRTFINFAGITIELNSQKQYIQKTKRWRYATTRAPGSGLNKITIPKATAWAENINEKFLFHLFSCHGNYGLSSLLSIMIGRSTLMLFASFAYSSWDKGVLDWASCHWGVFIPECV